MSAIVPRIRSESTRIGLVSLFLLAVTLGACSSDDPDIDPMQPPPVVLADSVVFTVTTFDTDGTPRVRWIGDEDGPLDISPEGTSMPWVGYGRRFEISWEAWSENGAVTGYQWRASQIPNVHFLPRDSEGQPEYADIRSLIPICVYEPL